MRTRSKVLLGLTGSLAAVTGIFALVLSHDAPCPTVDAQPAAGGTVKALRAYCYGGTAALEIEHVPKPVPADGEMLVRVHAAGVNPLDWHFLHGKPYVMRMSSGFGKPSEATVGVDFSGTVEAVGPAVSEFKPGDAIFGAGNGAFAEYIVVREAGSVTHKPANVSFEETAAVPIAAITALQAVRDHGKVTAGSRVLINGASGGVGTFAVQIAKNMGADVTGVSSARNSELVRALGADHTVDYAVTDFTQGGAVFDVIIDNVGNHSLGDLRSALKPEGILVMVTGPKKDAWLGPLWRMLGARLSAPFVSQQQTTVFAQSSKADMGILGGMLAAGTLRAVIDRRFSLEDAGAAIDYLEQGRTRGKNVLVMIPSPAGDANY